MPELWQKGLNADYGMGVFINTSDGRRRVWHGGDFDGFSTWLAHYPREGVTIAMVENSQSAQMHRDEIEAAVFAGMVEDGKAPAYCGK